MAHGHDHGEGADHVHSDVPAPIALRVMALQSLLVERGVIEQATIDEFIDRYEHRVGPHTGAAVVARAWIDEEFRVQLLRDGVEAAESMGVGGLGTTRLVALENTAEVHNVVVCTLCSCYPWKLLGPPPVWYKSAPYRSRVVIDPRSVLAEFGTTVADNVEVRVWDSNSEVRYLVIPERPEGTEGLSVEQLAGLVTRNAMIGVEAAHSPSGSS